MDLGLAGKVAIVTGAGRGIGKEIAHTFAEEGARPVIAEINEPLGLEAANSIKGALAVKVDIRSTESVNAMVKTVVEKLGRIDILVNNATIMAPAKQFMQETWDEMNAEIDVMYKGCLNCSRAVVEAMIKQGQGGAIVNLLSDAARIGEPWMVNYGAAKAAVGGFSRGLAKEVAEHKIRINCVSPSAIQTELSKGRREDERKKLGDDKFQDLQKKRLRMYPLGRFGEPQDIANAVVFLASERASWITGQTLSVNGGYAIGPW